MRVGEAFSNFIHTVSVDRQCMPALLACLLDSVKKLAHLVEGHTLFGNMQVCTYVGIFQPNPITAKSVHITGQKLDTIKKKNGKDGDNQS